MNLFIVQMFVKEVWKTVYVSSYQQDSDKAWKMYSGLNGQFPLRQVEVVHPSPDFLTHDARDFRVLLYQG